MMTLLGASSVSTYMKKSSRLGHNLVVMSLPLWLSSLAQNVYAVEEDYYRDEEDKETSDELLAEMLAKQKMEVEELAKLEAQMRELDEMKAHQQTMKEDDNTNMDFQNMEEEQSNKEAIAQEEAERKRAAEIAAKREEAFQAEIARAKNEKARKALKRQKAKDAKIVRRILNQAKKGHHYAILGFKCKWGEIKIGPFKFCTIKNGEVKKAYRNMARQVHPDKNRDGRAEEAFNLLELSSSILLDEKQRKEYDAKLKVQQKELLNTGLRTIDDTWKGLVKTLNAMKTILGPFATPIFVLVALII